MTIPVGTTEFVRVWGSSPSVIDQIAYVAAIDPARVAIDRPDSPVTFAELHAQVSSTAAVLAVQGLDAGISVNAAITSALPVSELAPAEIAARSEAVIVGIERAVHEVAGTEDLGTLPGILRSVSRREPDRIAVNDLDGGRLTYRELDERSDALAAGLIAAGAGPEQRVGVALPRTVDLIVALVATVKTGAAYLPLDSSHPIDRIRSIVDEAVPVLILAEPATIDRWEELGSSLATPGETAGNATESTRTALPRRIDPRHPAYVIYTSGSTGKPKGVVVTHDDVVTLLSAMAREYDYSPDDVWTMFQSYGFDLSVGEVWVALAFGGRLVVLDYLTTRAPDEFVDVLDREQVTVVNLTPSAFYQLAAAVREPAPGRLSQSLRSMIFVGEALDFAQVRRWFEDRRRYDGNDGPQLNNMYGPTEATVYLTRRELTPEFVDSTLASDIGTELAQSRLYVLDSRLKKVPDGVPGDLYLAGGQLARGYDGRFGLTASRFVADPFGAPGDRMYQSGDLAIIRGGGLEFLGRADDQVKVRGYRIELGEVESALETAEGVNAAAAAVKQRDGFPEQLVGYVVGAMPDGSPLDVAHVRSAAASKVPDYMVPDVVMVLEQMPLNASGKLDRRALPKPVLASQARYVAPENETEEQLAKIVTEVLGLERVSVTESIFELGGNSLLAAKIVGRASDTLGVYVNMRDIFAAPTVRALGARLGELGSALPALTAPETRPDLLPLSLAQERMWFINQFDRDDAAYNIPMTLRVSGDLDLDVLRVAVGDVIARHEVLRTVFADVDGVAVQRISPASDIAAKLDWRVLDSEGQFARAAAEGFDVTTSWPIRVLVWQTASDEHILGLITHHIAADGESLLPLVSDLVTAYTARRSGKAPQFAPLEIQFADFALWQRSALGSPDTPGTVLGDQLAYWREQLDGLPDVLELPADHQRPARATHHGEQIDFGITPTVADRLTALAREADATPFMVVHAALAVLLARLSATDDIAIATPTAGRGQDVLEPLVGMFVNTLVLRARVDPAMSFRELVEQVRADDLDAYANADIPFEALVNALDPVRSEAFSPLAQVMLSFDPAASAATAGLEVAGLTIASVPSPVIPAQVDLTVTIASAPESEPWSGAVVYATDLFAPSSAQRLADRFVRLLGELTAAPDRPVGDDPILLDGELASLKELSSGPTVDVAVGSIADAVAAHVVSTPEAVAVVFDGREVTYAEFGARVATLARELIAAGVGPETAVGVCIDRSVELLVAVHAVTAAGGQYVPVDPGAPAERTRVMLETADAEFVLVATGVVPAPVSGLPGVRVVEVDASGEVAAAAAAVTDADRLAPVSADNALYTLFTSGSTGVPKGVTVSHGAAVNLLEWICGAAISPDSRVLLKTPVTFDASVWELFAPLMAGATTVVARPDGHRDPEYLAQVIEAQQITVVQFVPSLLAIFVEDPSASRRLDSLRIVLSGGEALPQTVFERIASIAPKSQIINQYGPTEATVDSVVAFLERGRRVGIGLPTPNTQAYVLDDRLQFVPEQVPGELYLGGAQLARGYADAPGLTAERFVADPFGAEGSRLYRTGDLVRRLADGSLEYLGRTDFQVKLRGQRIELGEIESVIAAGAGVVHAAVTVTQAPTGGEFLVAYVSPASVDVEALREHVAAALPEYMQPSVWTVLDEVVLNTAGKLDRRALPAPDFSAAEGEYVAPVGAAEEQLAAIVGGLLGVDQVSVTESFFALGGDSIMSIRLASAARAAGWELSPKDIFESRTVRKMAVMGADPNRGVSLLEEPPGGGAGPSVIRPAVSWMVELSDTAHDFADFSQSAVLVAPEELTAQSLSEVLGAVVDVHPMLSAQLREVDGEWSLDAGTGFDVDGAVIEVTSPHRIESADFDADLRTAFDTVAGRLDPSRGRLVQAALVRDADDRARIVLVIHHIGVDTVSWPVIIEDLITAWAQWQDGVPFGLRAEETSARAWAAAVARRVDTFADQYGYWLQRLPERPTDLGAEFDRDRDRDRTASTVLHHVAADVTDAVLASATQSFQGNVNDVLLGTFARAVRRWQESCGIADEAPVSVLVEGHGRDEEILETGPEPVRADLSRTVGWFTTLIPMSLDPAGDVVHAIKAAKEERLGIPDHGVGFGELRYRSGGELAARPLPTILFNYLGSVAESRSETELPLTPVGQALEFPVSPAGRMAMAAGLVIDAVAVADGGSRQLRIRFRFAEALLSPAEVQDLAERWTSELADAVTAADAGVGLSPSDVPGSGITQQELDRIAVEVPDAQVWPLTPLQTGLFFQSGMVRDGELDAYHVQVRVQFGGQIDGDRLRAAMEALVGHHDVLRSGFRQISAGVVAVVPGEVSVPLREVDLTDRDDLAAHRCLEEIAEAERAARFDLSSPPLMRAVLVRHHDGADLVVTSHHILFDGWSGPLVLADLLAVYATGTPYTPVHEHGFADHARAVARTDAAASAAAWQETLAPVDGPTRIAPAGSTGIDQAPREVAFALSEHTSAEILRLARESGATLSTVLQAAWSVLLSRLTGNRVVTFGETVSGRSADLDGVDTMVGLFINTLPVVADVDPSVTFREMLAALQRDKVRVLDHQHVGLPDLARISPQALEFDTLFVHESYPVDTESISAVRSDGLELRGLSMRDASHYPVGFITEERDGVIRGHLKYLPGAFDEAQVQVFADAITEILRAGAAAPDQVVADLPLLDSDERDRVLAASSGPVTPRQARGAGGAALADAVAAQVIASPEAAALVFEGREVSYREFGARVATLARELIAVGIGPDVAVGVCIDRSVELLVAIHAVTAAGGQYVPVDTVAPAERARVMLATAGAQVVLVAGVAPEAVAGFEAVTLIEVDASGEVDLAVAAVTDADRLAPLHADNALYTLFTSGSTGVPKGVTVSRAAAANLLEWISAAVVSQDSRVLLKTPVTFDASVWELFAPLMVGATMVVARPDGHRDPAYLAQVIEAAAVTVVQFVPSMLAVFADDHALGEYLGSLRTVLSGGEALPEAVFERIAALTPNAQIINQYGPTEATVDSTFSVLERGRRVGIGYPAPNTCAYVLDDRLQLVPEGVPGELYLGGVQVARGYAAAPALTAERFVADPYGEPGSRLYRTGDLVKRQAGGDLEYLGRTDFQVKLRGQRIELGEIESVIAGAPGVVHAAAMVAAAAAGGEFLVGYVSPASVDLDAVKAHVAGALPEYMRPSVWTLLDEVTLSSSGKLDRRALPEPDLSSAAVEYVAPEGETEEVLAAVFADVLGVERVGVTESFFDAGGNSLSAMRVVARAGEVLGVDLSIRDLFDHPTVRELAAASVGRAAALPPVTAVVPRPDQIPLSFAQQRMWFINRLEPDAPTYNIPAVLRLAGDVDIAALRAAVVDVVSRHEVLRTTFPDVAGAPVQLIAPTSAVAANLAWTDAASIDDFQSAVAAGFDVSTQWPIRAVVHRDGDDVLFAVVAHHIGADGESMLPFITDVLVAYAARAAGELPVFADLPVQFADYAIWQHRVLGEPDDPDSVVGRQIGFWTEQLAGMPDVLELPADRPRPAIASHVGDEVGFTIPADIGARILGLSHESGATPFMVLHAALAVLLARLTATEDIAIATPTAGRGQAELDALVGMFVNTLVLRTQVDSAESFADLLAQVRATDLNALAHADVPFESVVEAVDPVRSEAFSPLAQVMLSVDAAASVAHADLQIAGITAQPLPAPVIPAQVDVTFNVYSAPVDADWVGAVTVAVDLFDQSTAQSLADRFVALLDALTADPRAAVGDAALLSSAEWAAAIELSAGPVVATPAGSVADAVAVQVAATPDAAALVFAGRVVSYGEFGARVAVLARELIAAGVGPDVAVGVCIDRSVELLVAIHAVTAAGGQYVPVDTGAPAERARVMLETAGAGVVLVAAGTSPEPVADLVGVRLLEVDASGEVDLAVSPVADVERLSPVRPESALYTLFTSGSTGVPKGVTVSHGAVLNRLRWGLAAFPWTSGDRIILKTPYTFDVSVPELYAPLMAGATVVIAKPDGHRDPGYIADLIVESQATSVHFVPSMLSVFLDVVDREKLASLTSLRWLFASGEALPPATVKAAHEIWPGIGIHNLFGPTEAAVEVGWADVSDAPDVVTIGRPVWNTSMLVLDDRLRPVPDGVPGELYLGGVQVARGYAAAPALTAERFVADPFGEPGGRLYRTGDLVKRLPGGDIEYLGRTDFQVKLRGQRIELGEIESVIAGAPGVVHAAAMVAAAAAGGEFLVGYVSPASVDLDAVKAHVAGALPEYMRPSVWTLLDEVTLSSSGKLDRRPLPEPDLSSAAVEYVAPEGETEEVLAAVFADVLGVERVGVTESFFDAGGNSLSAMRVVARAGEVLGVDLSIRDLFDHPTVRELAAASVGRAAALPPVTAVVPRPDQIPLSFAQQRMWFINRFDPSAPTYNIPGAFRLRGPVDLDALHSAFVDVVQRHEVLHSVFPDIDGRPFQSITPIEGVERALDWQIVDTPEAVAADLSRGFDVTLDLPLRGRVLREAEDSFVLAVVAHHIAFDGQSFAPMVADVLAAYAARTAGETPVFDPLPVQYADYASWQHDVLGAPEDSESVIGGQLDYWRSALAGAPDVINLPIDRPRPPVFSSHGDHVQFPIPAELGSRIDEFASRSGATRFMVLHAAFTVLLSRITGSDDVMIGTPIDDRGRRDLGALVGMFVNTLVLRNHVDPGESFTDFLTRARAADLEAFAHADVPFESVVEAVDPVRSEAFSPLVQVIFSVDPLSTPSQGSIAGVTIEAVDPPETPAQMDLNLTISAGEPSQDWSGALTYATAIFDRSTIEKLGERFVALLGDLLSAPERPVGDVAVAGAEELDRVMAESVGSVEPTLDETIADAVLAQVEARPDALALVAGEREFSYGEFGARIGELARALIGAGVGPETAVGLVMDRSVELVTSVHAVLAAGGQYVPIAMDSPAERAEYVATTAGVKLVLVAKGAAVPEFVAGLNVPVLEVDCSTELPDKVKPLDPSERLAPLRTSDAAYTLFTSGSTGLPKGVTIPHGAVRNFVAWFDQTVPTGDQRLLFKTPHTFDASVLELFWPLVAGQTMVIADAGGERDPQYLADVMNAADVSVVQFVPSLLAAFLDIVGDESLLPKLQVLFSGGEALPPAVAKDFRRRVPQAKVVNLFGPTEAAVYTMSAVLDEVGQVVPIGAPMANTTAFILDSRLHPVPDGVAGELYLGGVQSARGYASRPDLTAERFIADPFGGDGARLYRTGDVVKRSTASGELEYLGRTDFQVKLRGQRLELGEVESAIAGVGGVVHAAARVVEGPAGDQLVGYVAPASVDTGQVAVELAKHLPEYMVPTAWVALEQMPLNAAGKVDRRSLPDPELAAAEYVAPETAEEETVAAVFADLLGVDHVSVIESFFDAGGNSLAAMRLVARVGDALGVQVSVRDVFDAPSVRELVAAVAGRAPALPPVAKVEPRPLHIPLSFAQQRMWFINQLDGAAATYNIPLLLRLRGEVDSAALEAALIDVVARHEVLRTTFPAIDGVPTQRIHSADDVRGRLDWAVTSDSAELERSVVEGFDVTTEFPVRARLLTVDDDESIIAVVVHHIAFDRESMTPFATDLLAAYAARVAGSEPVFGELPVSFADYAIWQHQTLGSVGDTASIVSSQLDYWKTQLAGLPDVLELPADRPRPQHASGSGATRPFAIPSELSVAISELAARQQVTPFMVLHAAWSVVLARLSSTNDIAVSTPVAGRGQAELDALIGMFVNTLVLRTQIDLDESFEALVDRVRDIDLAAFGNADVPFESVVEAVSPVRSEAFSPLAQVSLTYQDVRADADRPTVIGGIEASAVDVPNPPAQRDLALTIQSRGDDDWSGSILFATDLFDAESVAILAERFVHLLQEVVDNPQRAVGDADLLTAAEHALLDADLSGESWVAGADVEVGAPDTGADLVAIAAAASPEQTAVLYDGAEITYLEFAHRVAELARTLIAHGVGPETAVAVRIDRSVEQYLAVHAVVAAGAQYVPVDPAFPAARVDYLIGTSQAQVVLVAAGSEPFEASDESLLVLTVDASSELPSDAAPLAPSERLGEVLPESAAYTIFTSGSTGQPKGVTVTHRGLRNMLGWFTESNGDQAHRFLLKTPFTFDASVWELFGPVFAAAPVVIAEAGGHRDPRYLAELIRDNAVTTVKFVPSMLAAFLDGATGVDVTSIGSLRRIFSGGEVLTPALAAGLIDAVPEAHVINQYGPTEAVVDITYRRAFGTEDTIPIGSPVWNSTVYVLDDRLNPVPEGVVGEMYLGGEQIARGYASRPGLTAGTFVANPFGPLGSRLYRTGDRAKWTAGGELEYFGRADFQVKLGGQRIELGEIEAVAATVPGVLLTAVVVAKAPGGVDQLVGYLSARSGETVDVDEVRVTMARSVPEFMRPRTWMVLDELPQTTSGKVDRRALPAPVFAEQEYVAPETPEEEAVAAVFADLLGLDQIGVTDDFFDVGGNSLSAMRLVARVSDALGVEVSVRDVFAAPSVRALIEETRGRMPALAPVTAVEPRPERIPLSFAQHRMWLINRLDPTTPMYNQPTVLRVTGDLDVDALRAAMVDVVVRHEVLRTTFPTHGAMPYQQIGDVDSVPDQLDWKVVDSEDEIRAAATTGFDLVRERPIRVRVWEAAPGEFVVALVTNHIASDGESRLPLVTDLFVAYSAHTGGAAPQFSPLPVQFADYAIWQHEVLGSPDDPESVVGRQLDHWKWALAGLPDLVELPADRPRPAVASGVSQF
ncbi:non-ribosomal peptide synthase/polyketide synthase [Gordonia alkaliphila]|uniref:non-ribosomal peptide synthase/polyketide synthase n=1 Tax=Gordonia alkaliphila TaxID=1053547 RepID=UPI001FF5DF6E|nr:non-ribosomal peptide synthase/polyketide synthase [Gordonia alkaliphila]MCK0438396.1 non-ribosomal peptide synthase/polyketide synthase [Gordonia alkaliphila]